jgi:bla regulator protein BlaR1
MLAGTWTIGMIVMTALTIKAWLQLSKIKNSVSNVKNKKVLSLFEECKQRLNISKPLIIGESPLTQSPLTFGLFKTYVVLPVHFEKWLTTNEMKYILLHELNHYKHKDILTNYLIVFYQILYWFQPLVWIGFREMKLDREVACDSAVLHSLDKHGYVEYGNTLINFVDNISKQKYITLTHPLNGAKKQVKQRIESIASFTIESKQRKRKSIAIFSALGCFVASMFPLYSIMAYDDQVYQFDEKQTVYEDLSKYFNGYEGSFVLYDLQADQYHIYNKNKSSLRVSPNSTYKIYSALFALESNVITMNQSAMKWNGQQYQYDAWNKDQNLSSAMKYSVNWYFQEIDKKVQQDQIQQYLRKINYGNYDLSGGLSQFWIESSLKISPIEQVQLLKALYKNELGFKERNIEILKKVIHLEAKNQAQLFGKTGTVSVNGKDINGWFVGYVETKKNTYFFATNIQSENQSYGSKAAEITKSILRDKNIY